LQLLEGLAVGHGALRAGRGGAEGAGHVEDGEAVVLPHEGDGVLQGGGVEEEVLAVEEEPGDGEVDEDGDVDGLAEAGAGALVVEFVEEVNEFVFFEFPEAAGPDLFGLSGRLRGRRRFERRICHVDTDVCGEQKFPWEAPRGINLGIIHRSWSMLARNRFQLKECL
jgi:hypothetical protein